MASSTGDTPSTPFTDWYLEGSEIFEFFGQAWNVGAARRIVAANPRQLYPIEVPDLKGIMRMMDIKPEKVAHADVTVPLLVVKAGNWPASRHGAVVIVPDNHDRGCRRCRRK
jgi:hypothetical protein